MHTSSGCWQHTEVFCSFSDETKILAYLLGPVCPPAEAQYSWNRSLSLPSQPSSYLSLVSLDYASNLSPSLGNAVFDPHVSVITAALKIISVALSLTSVTSFLDFINYLCLTCNIKYVCLLFSRLSILSHLSHLLHYYNIYFCLHLTITKLENF